MSEPEQKATRWEPISGLPETPCGEFSIESPHTGSLKLTMRYSLIKESADRDLLLNFSETLAFRVYWDRDGAGLIEGPHCDGAEFHYIWPLLEITNSRWLASGDFEASLAIAKARREEAWKHYAAISLERHIDVIARGSVSANWIYPAPGKRS